MSQENILLAALGEHPAVVTAMVRALRELENINIDKLHLFHPQNTGKYIGREGVNIITNHLAEQCNVIPEPLNFADPNNREYSMEFLQRLAQVLSVYQNAQKYRVYLCLAGGRKHMAALMALMAQFYPSIRGLYHLLNKRQTDPRYTFPSIEELQIDLTESQVKDSLAPPIEMLNLIPIPYPGPFANATELWQFLNKGPEFTDNVSVALPEEAEHFFEEVFKPGSQSGQTLEVWLTQTAYARYQELVTKGDNHAKEFLECFRQMRSPERLKGQIHGTFGEFHFYKRRRTTERPYYYTTPNPIYLFPQKPVEKVIICDLAIEQGNGQYKPTAEEISSKITQSPPEPAKRATELVAKKLTLIVPLGQSPMVATQTYELLNDAKEYGNIATVAIIYPEKFAPIRNAARLLQTMFKGKDVDFQAYPIKELQDIDSEQACKTYLGNLLKVIEELRASYPEQEVVLSLSGGRKGMSVLTLLAAQRAGVNYLFHTLINDPELEKQIEQETSKEALDHLPSNRRRAERLFLETYDREKFELFTIPVIPFQS